ncbi:putative endoplasmic reticulum membrane protein C16E8.02 [Phytophthora citrophthora]|uniref:Endoplasmic reticulum membrane protein C16E8.02 n=1 Tax=Phytophthora citrophthora TaxID=4793 RepID=A0AAD9LKW1_9STRA|nr:putative endoplasmic reticulum membrane protein C16E8.02 [Phytophthora citrophthora]
MGFIADRFDLEKQVTFYLSYHDNKINQYIHLACIWPIFISGLMILAHTQPLAETPAFLSSLPYGEFVLLNYAAVMAGIYMLWYMALDIFAGTLGAAIISICFVFANYFVVEGAKAMDVHSMHVALAIHATAWILQFIGHGVFERRKPALFESLDQAIITAPMFVLLEILFPLGYRPDLYQRVMKQVRINVKNFQATKTL